MYRYVCMHVCIDSSTRRPNRLELENNHLFATTTPFCIWLFFLVCFRFLPPVDLYIIYVLLT